MLIVVIMSKLWISEEVINVMKDLASSMSPNETGGVLLGYFAESKDIVVTTIIGPGPKALHARYSFNPDAEFHQMEIAKHYYNSNGVETYLGDWHTHPFGTHELSNTDKKTLAKIATTPESQNSNPIMLIIYGDASSWCLSGVKFLGNNKTFFKNNYILEFLNIVTY